MKKSFERDGVLMLALLFVAVLGGWELFRLLNGLLEKLHLSDLDAGDILLLILLFFLFRQEADEELLIAIGLLLIL